MTPAELAEACREHGLESSADCALAVLEVDGSISIVPKGASTHRLPIAKRRRKRRHR